jgi:RND family efflux transporter MFP subunit
MSDQPHDLVPESVPSDVPPMPPPWRRTLPKVVAAMGSLIVGLVAAVGLVKAGSAAEKGTPPEKVDLVEAVTLAPADARASVQATGSVVADQQVTLVPEVAGRLVWVSEKLVPGARFAQGETIARVDGRDYQVALEAEQSRLRQAELELALEENRGQVAAREWELLGAEAGGDGKLARREPHLEVARANVEAVAASVRRAELNLSRTSIRAPFNAVVLQEMVDVGQVVGSGSQVAVLSGSDRVRVETSVPVDRLPALAIPGVDGVAAGEGSPATVRHHLGNGRTLTFDGQVIGMGGQLDPLTRTATVIVAVDDPLEPQAGGLPLLVGAFVDVTLRGRTREDALTVPRTAVYDGETVWVVHDDRLQPRTIQVGWSLAEEVEVVAGLSAGEQIVTTPLSAPVAGTRVRLVGEDGAADGGE